MIYASLPAKNSNIPHSYIVKLAKGKCSMATNI